MDNKIQTFTKISYPYLFLILFLLLSTIVLIEVLSPLEPLSLFRLAFISSSSTLLDGCDYSYGKWVYDESYIVNGSYSESCPFLDPGFQCARNGRMDTEFQNWRWEPSGCDLPRFNGTEMLQRSRNKRIIFAGDSIGRNQWESLLCMLWISVENKSNIYEVNGNPISKHKGFLSIKFHDYNLTVEYYRSPFLVVVGRPPSNSSDNIRSSIQVDTPVWMSKAWKGADVLVLNTGHWWNDDKTVKKGRYFQVGDKINTTMDLKTGFEKSIETMKKWASENLKLEKSFLFFRSYSPTHYRHGTWDSGGACDPWTEPESNLKNIEPEPWYNRAISDTIHEANGNVHFLNITYLTELRKDGHASKYREPGTPADAPQDCSHWCLPGVPDTWNQFLYAYLISYGYGT